MNVTVDADNLPFDGRAEFGNSRDQLLHDNALRQRIHLRQMLLGKGFIDDGDWQAASNVLFGKSAALKHADSKGPEIFGSHHIEARARTRGRIVDGLPSEIEEHAKVRADDRHACG